MNNASKYPMPVKLLNLGYWASKTARFDFEYYINKNRPLRARRIYFSIFPKIREPIFVIGSPRSGTTFLGSCIGALPEVSYHFEPVAIKGAARYIYLNLWSFRKAKLFYKTIYKWLLRVHINGDLRLAEKTPRNCLIILFLSRVFPDAKFIYIHRDGRDAALSHSKKPWLLAEMADSNLIEPGGYPFGPSARFWVEKNRRKEFENTSDLHRCIWNWRVYNEHALKASKSLTHNQYLSIKYESLIKNPGKWGKIILDFLKIEKEESRSIFLRQAEKAWTDSIGKWKHQLNTPQLDLVYKEAGKLLHELGYIH